MDCIRHGICLLHLYNKIPKYIIIKLAFHMGVEWYRVSQRIATKSSLHCQSVSQNAVTCRRVPEHVVGCRSVSQKVEELKKVFPL